VSCRETRAKRDLIRIVRAPDGSVRVDASGRANGRGAYVCRDAACIDHAIDRGALSRALHAALPGMLRAELRTAAGLVEA
jgi:predicted RNA-binding protein YlxR (DUF448 family)